MKTIKRPPFFRAITGLDVGFVDRSALLFAYVDFVQGTIVIEGEALLGRATTQDIADVLHSKERALWGPERLSGGHKQPFERVSDLDHRLIADLRSQHGLEFRAVEKKNFDSDINLVNVLITGKQLLVSDECPELRRQLREGVYAKNHRDMARDGLGGHNDLLACLRYLCRRAERLFRMNPYPTGYRVNGSALLDTNAHTKAAAPPLGLMPDTALGRRMAKWTMRHR